MSASPLPVTDVLARAAAADRRIDARLATAIADIFLPERDRLDERTRATVAALLEATVSAAEREIAGHAARLLATRGQGDVAQRLNANHSLALPRLAAAGLLRDADLMAELIAQARIDLIDAAPAVRSGALAPPSPTDVPIVLDRVTVAFPGREALLSFVELRDGPIRLRHPRSTSILADGTCEDGRQAGSAAGQAPAVGRRAVSYPAGA